MTMQLPPEAFINRELSWLEFNQRVLEQAMYGKVPLLERLKFLAITASNLDEFFMVRVGSLQIQEEQQPDRKDPTGHTPAEQLAMVHDRVDDIVSDQYKCYLEQIEPNLRAEGLEHVHLASASMRHREAAERVFLEEIYPLVSPMHVTVDQFPLLSNLGLYLLVRVKKNSLLEQGDALNTDSDDEGNNGGCFLLPMGASTPRFITLPSDRGYCYALSEDIVSTFIHHFFPTSEVVECVPFRMTRNSDISVREDGAFDLMRGMEKVLSARRVAESVRIEIASNASDDAKKFLQDALRLSPRDLFRIPGPLDLASMMHLTNTEGFPALRDSAWTPQRSPLVDPSVSMFQTIAQQDVLLCHPYESFEPVVRWLEEAAEDPDVLAIKQVLYRTSRSSAIVSALKRAAEKASTSQPWSN